MEEYTPSRYKILEKIGEGVHGYVFKAIDLHANKTVAIKKVALKNKFGNISLNTLREIKVLQMCKNDYILPLNDIFPDLIGLSLVLEYMPETLYSKLKNDLNPLSRQQVRKFSLMMLKGIEYLHGMGIMHRILPLNDIFPDLIGLSLVLEYMPETLYSKLKNDLNPLSRQQVRKFSLMMLKGIEYLHGMGIMHRDIKPANLLISENEILKIADFGLARLYFPEEENKLYSPQVSTRWYRAPEILWGSQKYGPTVDMWAAGCVIAEMLRGVPLFAGTTDIEQLALVIRTLGTPRQSEWPELPSLPDFNKIRFPNAVGVHWDNLFPSCTRSIEINLVSNLVIYNPRNRLTASEATRHDYFC